MVPSLKQNCHLKMESNLNLDEVNELIALAQASTEDAIEKENSSSFSPMMTRARSLVKNTIPDNFQKVKSSAITLLKGKKLSPKIEEEDPNRRVTITINWIVSLLKDLFKKVNNHSELIADLMNKILEIMEPKETIGNDCSKNHEELAAKTEVVEKALVESHEALHAEFDMKNKELELKYDEVRQRSLKGNLIISSPQINRNGSVVDTLAVRDNARNSVRKESVTEMVVRLVKLKTGQEIPLQDITACHPIGRKESNSFILCVANRKPGSAWDIITTGMRKGFNDNQNIFISYQLTDRRIALSKEVKLAKKDKLIKKFSIDANGKIWIKPLNKDYFREVTSKENLQKLINDIDI